MSVSVQRMAINTFSTFLGKRQLDVLIFVLGMADMDMRDGLHLSGKGAAVFADELADDQQQLKVAWEA